MQPYIKTKIPNVYTLKLNTPLHAQYEVTSNCNYNCIFCYNVWKDGCTKRQIKTLNKKQRMHIIKKIIGAKVFTLILSGGEPLLVSDLEHIVKLTTSKGIQVQLITNGSLLTKKHAEALKKAGLYSIQVSLHNYNPLGSDNVTQTKNSLGKTTKGIKNALKYFGSKVGINMVATPTTYNDVYKTAEYIHSLGIKSFTVGVPSATGLANKNKIIIGQKIFRSILKQLLQAQKKFKLHVGLTGGLPLCLFGKTMNQSKWNLVRNICNAGMNQIVISSDGKVRPCVCFNVIVGDLLKDDLQKIWTKSKFLNSLRKFEDVPKMCKKCKYVFCCKGGCRASAFAYFGKLDAPDPTLVVHD